MGTLAGGCDYYEKPNQPMPDLGLSKADGRSLSPEMMKGSPWIISVWLPGCGICAREVPVLESVRREYEPKGIKFLALSIDADAEASQWSAGKMGITTDIAVATGPVLERLGLRGVPATLFVSSDGTVIARASGARGRGFFERRADDLLAQKKSAP